ncbi:flagellar protein FliS [Fictibacillus macauensis ZFHKF-1]|uniref:Flagellar secretion chaperone FliS n=1 Tax=Fictibacillus macauensis ZFHKF-1 TaxID=1196324 RepID=I8J588_9BACL|nr:flagellar export chaperone FliS [Fictibacillus macauensis]EIT86946.1 flagellar protein FliS [Fictibacillus macauensis ZFHKF-1]
MSIQNPNLLYQNNAVATASPGDLIVMLYNGCLKFITTAKQAIINHDIPLKNTMIQKAQKIIQELMVTLNPEVMLSESLLSLYDYMHRRLIQANIETNIRYLEEVESYLVDLRDTWKEVVRMQPRTLYRSGDCV